MRADRLLELMLLLQQKGKQTSAELSEALHVSQRTIYRDIDALSAMGVPVYADGGPGGGYGLLENYRTSLTGLNEKEIQALFSMTVPNQAAALTEGDHLNRAFLKLASVLPQRYQYYLGQTEKRLYLDTSPWFETGQATPHLQTLQKAIWQDQMVDISYTRQDKSMGQRLVAPYALAAKSDTWYLVAETEDGMRVFRVSRIDGVVVQDEIFDRSAEFDLPSFWQRWVEAYEKSLPGYPVTINVLPAAEEWLVQRFGDSVRDLLDSAETVNGRKQIVVMFERVEEAHAYLVGLGNSAEIVRPVQLKNMVKETAQGIIDFYQSNA